MFNEIFDFKTFCDLSPQNSDRWIDQQVRHAVLQELGEIPYYRRFGTGYKKFENKPISLSMLVDLSVNLIQSVGKYNNDVTSSIDRRVAIPFDSIEISDDGANNGEIDLFFDYYRLKDKNLLKVQL